LKNAEKHSKNGGGFKIRRVVLSTSTKKTVVFQEKEENIMSERMVICPTCKRSKVEKCPVCGGMCRDPRDRSKDCTYCDGIGYIPCQTCGGRGEVSISEFNDMTY